MGTQTHHSDEARAYASVGFFLVPLERETRTTVDTATAALHLNRQPQTLRAWASGQSGALQPLRINGRLAWPVAELRRVLGVLA